MKIDFEELESPYFDGEVEFVAPAYELRQSLASVIDESPFTNLVGVSGTETSRIAHSGAEAPELETRDSDGPLAETWIEGETEYDAEERTYDDYVVEESDSSTRFEHALPRPATKKTEEVPQRRHILVVDDQDKPVAEGEYAFHQGNLIERGMLDATGGLAFFGRIDPPKPFVLEVRDRVCAILAGAFLNPDDPKIEYGGTWFDWTMVRDGKNPDKNFWPHYLAEMKAASGRRGVDAFWQHEHITRRPIQIPEMLMEKGKAPSQWKNDPRARCLTNAQREGIDALPELRKRIRQACLTPPAKDQAAPYQTGKSLEWRYRLPFDPPFLVPDCRTRKYLHPADDNLTNIDLNVSPRSQTIDDAQITWMREILVENTRRSTSPVWRGGPVVFIAPSTPLFMPNKIMNIMLNPETYASAWETTDPIAVFGAAIDSSKITWAKKALVQRFRRARDLEHLIRDKSWHDLWGIFDAMRKAGSPVKTVALVSGDVRHSYCMTGSLDGGKSERPEALQITASGFQTTIRGDWKTDIAGKQSNEAFRIGRYKLAPGFLRKNGTGEPEVALYVNCAALVKVTIGMEVDVRVDFLTGKDVRVNKPTDTYVYKYSSGHRK